VFGHGSYSHTTPTAHGSEVAISRAGAFKVLRTEGRVYNFSTPEESQLSDLLSDETWCNKVLFLADISKALNTVNKSMHEKNENILTCTEKINPFKEKLILWTANVEMFQLTKICRVDKFNSTKFMTAE
jgi:hypothetical protein